MLQLPEKGFSRSVNKSNVSPNALGDWLEACSLFDGPKVSHSDVVDMLIEGQICDAEDQDLAHSIVEEGWTELTRRKRWGGVPDATIIGPNRLETRQQWEEDLIRSFFLYLSLLRIYPEWGKGHHDHVRQGDLFERVCEVICPQLLPGWQTYRAGWAPDDTKNIPGILAELVARIFVKGNADLDAWLSGDEKDGGLDIVCYRAFQDEREAMPVFFLQCASGKNWRDKVQTPNPQYWKTLMDAAVLPSTGIIAPFVIEDQQLRIASLLGQTVVFDRLRLISAVQSGGIALDAGLRDELRDWLRPRIGALPRAS